MCSGIRERQDVPIRLTGRKREYPYTATETRKTSSAATAVIPDKTHAANFIGPACLIGVQDGRRLADDSALSEGSARQQMSEIAGSDPEGNHRLTSSRQVVREFGGPVPTLSRLPHEQEMVKTKYAAGPLSFSAWQ
jgi:hypothetical protein